MSQTTAGTAREVEGRASVAPAAWDDVRRQLVAFVARRVEQLDVAEDITQGVLERMARAEPGSIEHPQAWLHRAARNAIVDHYRTRRADLPLDDDVEPLGDVGPEDVVLQPERELARCLRPLVDELPANYRRALLLVDLGGASNEEAARQEQISISGMKSRVQRGRRLLAGLLSGCCRVTLNTDNSVDDYLAPDDCSCSGPGAG